jgi:hypothetical protein
MEVVADGRLALADLAAGQGVCGILCGRRLSWKQAEQETRQNIDLCAGGGYDASSRTGAA